MNPVQLLAHFDRISETPDAIPRLRRFVLDLAVRGKLVEQDPKDEPASELLKRIQREKARLVMEGKLKRAATGSVESGIDGPFSLPSSWAWGYLGIVAQYGLPDKVDSNKDIAVDTWVLDLEDIEKGTSRLIERILSSARPFRSTKTIFKRGDVLFGKLRPYLNKVLVADQDGVCTTEIIPVRGYCEMVPEYVKLVLKSPLTMARVDRLMYGMKMPRLGTGDAVALNFPLPPLAEQHRIVAKVDELMVLCDRLAAAQVERESRRDRVVAASLHRLNNGADAHAFREHARFHFRHLPRLTSRHTHIKQLRQTILNLAVRGSLVPRNRNEADRSPAPVRDLGHLVKVVRGSSPRPKADPRYYGGSVPRLLIADITRDGKYVTPQIDSLTDEGARLSRPMPRGSLVLAISGSYGVPAFLSVDACIHDGFIGFRDVSPEISVEYLFLVMLWRKPYFDSVVKDSGLKNLTTDHLKKMPVPVPPLAEQHLIIAKVDELMALCDRLEAQLTTTAFARHELLEATIHQAISEQVELQQSARR